MVKMGAQRATTSSKTLEAKSHAGATTYRSSHIGKICFEMRGRAKTNKCV